MSMKRLMLGMAAGLLMLAGTGASAADKGSVYYLYPESLDQFQTDSVKAISHFLGQVGYDLVALDAQNRSDLQLNQLDSTILLKPKAIVLAAVDFDAAVPGIEKARAAGIPVLVFDRQIKSTKLDLTSVAGTVEIGHIAADQISQLLKQRKGAVKGKVLQILGDPGDSYTINIQKGFEEKMAAYPDVTLITKAALQWEPTNAANIVQDQLQANPDIDLIYYHSGHLGGAVAAVLEAAGKKAGDIMLVGSDGDPVALDLIRKGWEQVEIEQPMYAQAYGIAMFIDKIVKGEPLKAGTYDVLGIPSELTIEDWGPNLKIPGDAINKDNVDDPSHWGNDKTPTAEVQPVE